MIKALELSFSYSDKTLISDISFTLNRGEVLAILGPNGVGKTTLLKILTGLIKKYRGSVKIEKEVTYVPQSLSAGVNYTVYNMILLGRAGHIGIFSSPSSEDREKAYEAMKKTGLEHLAERNFLEISGGERQLTLIARALASEAEILLLDEPTSDLDIKNQGLILELLSKLSGESKFTIAFSTHDPSHALLVTDKVLFLGKEGYSLFGNTDMLINEENIGKFYSTNVKIAKFKIGGKFYNYCLPIYNIK